VRFRRREERGLRRRLRDAEQMKQDNYRKKKRDASDTLKLSNMDDVLISTFHFYLMAIIHSVHSHINISFSYIYILWKILNCPFLKITTFLFYDNSSHFTQKILDI
jgi:hypothetical protein